MKKCFFLIFIFWGSVTFCKAQLDITKLQKSKEYINCQLTYLYLINPQNGIAKNTNLEDLKNFVAAPAIGSSLNIEGLTNYFKSNKSIIKSLLEVSLTVFVKNNGGYPRINSLGFAPFESNFLTRTTS